jgi:hypothetical protein
MQLPVFNSNPSANAGPRSVGLGRFGHGLENLFTRSSARRHSTSNSSTTSDAGPKMPWLGLSNLSTGRLVIPYLSRPATPSSRPATARSPTASPPPHLPSSAVSQNITAPVSSDRLERVQRVPSTVAPVHQGNPGAFIAVDPAEQHLQDLVDTGRRRRHRTRKAKASRHTCFPAIRHRKIRSKVISCLVSGIFLAVVLTICKSYTFL